MENETIKFHIGDCREVLKTLPAGSVDCVVTSPPYFGLRSYQGGDKEIGLEQSPAEYVAALVEVFREVKRVLRPDGTVWINLGDSFSNKQLLGIPWKVAFALQKDGWYLRADIIWDKPNAMPESVRDRPTKSHEYIFLLTKSSKYFYDATSITEPSKTITNKSGKGKYDLNNEFKARALTLAEPSENRNKRTVWKIATQSYSGAHFATFPEKLIEPCILAGCPVGGVVLDPFAGSGTTGKVAKQHGRGAILIELNPTYIELAKQRCA